MANNNPQAGAGATGIDALWQKLTSNNYIDSTGTILKLPAQNNLGSQPISNLLANASLFPSGQLSIALQPPVTGPAGNLIVMTGVLQDKFLGVSTPAAKVTFFIDNQQTAQLYLVLTMPGGYTLKVSFAALAGTLPGDQAFSAAAFTAASDSTGPLSFSGTPVPSADISGLWPKGCPPIKGAVTLPTNNNGFPGFTLQNPLAPAPFNAGQAPLSVQLQLASDAAGAKATTSVLGQVTASQNWPPIPVSLTLPISSVRPVLASPPLTQQVSDLIDLAALYLGQALANLIPAQFPIGNQFQLRSLTITLTSGCGALLNVQTTIGLFDPTHEIPLLPGNLANLENIRISFVQGLDLKSVTVVFNGDFGFGSSGPKFRAGFILPGAIVSANNIAPIDVGELVGVIIPGLHPPRNQLTIQTLSATLDPINKTYSFSGEVDFGTDWHIDVGRGVQLLALEQVTFSAVRSSGDLAVTFGATLDLFESTFNLTAEHPGSGQGWVFSGQMVPTTPLKLRTVAAGLLPFVPSGFVPDIEVLQLSGNFNTSLNTFQIAAELQWDIDFIPNTDVVITADFLLQSSRASKNDPSTFSGYIKGKIDINKLELDVAYIFDPNSQDVIFQYRELQVDWHRSDTDPYVSISLGHSTVGSLVEFLLSFADPGNEIKLSAPWDALEKVALPDLTVKVHLKSKEIDVEADMSIDLGFIKISKFTLTYVRQYGKPSFKVGLVGDFLGQTYSDANPLTWDMANEPAPAVPGKGTQVFDLEYLGMGQHITLRQQPLPSTMDGVIAALENALTPVSDPNQNPATQLPGLMFDAGSNWLIGTRFTVMSTVELSVVFNDPYLYGLLIQLSGDKAGALAGLRFEILYRKISDSIGVYHIELTLPDEFRHLEFGEVSITLPIVTIDIYTNGNFRIDCGFPPSLTDFSRSISVQVLPFIGYAGFYFAVLDGQTSTNVPQIDNGEFNPVLEFGFALQVGVGKDLSLGILTGGISITVGGMLQGVLAWFHPTDKSLPVEMLYKLMGTVAIVGEVYATVDFGIISASVSLTVYISASVDIEAYKAIHLSASAGVSVEVSIKIVFVRIHFSFSATITESFTIGSDSTPPWHAVSNGSGGQQQQLKQGAQALLRATPHAALRQRAPRALAAQAVMLRAAAAPSTSINVTAIPFISQAVPSDFAFPGGPTPLPTSATTPVLAMLLGVNTSTDPSGGFNQLMTMLLGWALDSIGHEHDGISAAVLDEIQQALRADNAADKYLKYSDLVGLFTSRNIVFNLIPRATTQPTWTVGASQSLNDIVAANPGLGLSAASLAFFNQNTTGLLVVGQSIDGQQIGANDTFATMAGKLGISVQALGTLVAARTDILKQNAVMQWLVDMAFMAMIPEITLSAPGYTINFAADRIPQGDYEQIVEDYFADLMAQFARPSTPPAAKAPPPSESLATFMFRNYFLMLARSAVQSARDALRNATFTVTDTTATLTSIANSFNNDYTVRSGDDVNKIAGMFGIAVDALKAANATVDFTALVVGSTLFIPTLTVSYTSQTGDTAANLAACFGIAVADLEAANPGVNFGSLQPGTALTIPALRVAHTSLADETAQHIATEFGITLGALAAANPGVSLNPLAAGTALLIPLRVDPAAVAAANQTATGILNTNAVMNVGDIPVTAAATDSLASLAGTFGVPLVNLMSANQESLTLLNPGQTITLGNLSSQTRVGHSLNGLAAYWYSPQVDATALSAGVVALIAGKLSARLSVANSFATNDPRFPMLRLVTPQTLTLPLTAGNTDYTVQTNDTVASIAAAYAAQGATVANIVQSNSGIQVDSSQLLFPLATEQSAPIAVLTNDPRFPVLRLATPQTLVLPLTGGNSSYAVQTSDSVASIAAAYAAQGATVAKIIQSNSGIRLDPYQQILVLPLTGGNLSYFVQAGDTLATIAAVYASQGATMAGIAAANPVITLDARQAAAALAADVVVLANANPNLALAVKQAVQISLATSDPRFPALQLSTPQTLVLPLTAGITNYTVQPNDTVASIAAAYASRGATVDNIIQSNSGIKLDPNQTMPQILLLPLTSGDLSYSVKSKDTLASIAAAYASQGATVDNIAAYNGVITLNAGQPVVLPNVQHIPSTSYFVQYTATSASDPITSDDTLATIAKAYFPPDTPTHKNQDAAILKLQQWNGNIAKDAKLATGSIVQIPYSSSLKNIDRVYNVNLQTLSSNPAISLTTLLVPRAQLTAPQVSHTIAAGDTLASIAQAYNLNISQLASRIAVEPGLFAQTTLKVANVPAMKFAPLAASLATGGSFTNAANMASRFMMHGLRLPAPQFAGLTAPGNTAYPLYALVGQEYPVATPVPSPYAITLTPSSATWLQTAGGVLTLPLDAAETQRISDFQTLSFQPGVPQNQIQPLSQYTYVPDQQPVRQIRPWLTPDLPAGLTVSDQKAGQPSVWPLPDALIGAVAASPQGRLPYQAVVGHRQTDGTLDTSVLQATRWATSVDITIQQLSDAVPGTYLMLGADQDGMQRLLAAWARLSSTGGGSTLYFVYPQQSTSNSGSGAVVSDAIDRANTFLLKTNLSTESHGEQTVALRALRSAPSLTSGAGASPAATLNPTDSTRFLELLWECSVVKSGGYYLRYAVNGGQLGVPGTLFQSGRQAMLKLVIVMDEQGAGSPLVLPFNNAMLVGDNVDAGASNLFFQAIVHEVVANDTLQIIAGQYPYLSLNPGTLAVANQTIMGLLVAGSTVAGQPVGPGDTFGTIAAKTNLSVQYLGTAVANTTGILTQGALVQLAGNPVQTVNSGDTLALISQEYDFLDPAALAALNATAPNLLAATAEMTIPGQANPYPIVSGDTFLSVAKTHGVDVSALGEANGENEILAAGASIQVAGNQLRMTATLPPGHVGFNIVRPNPQPADITQETAQQALDALFNLLGFQITGNQFFNASLEGLPAGPGNDAAGAQDAAQWNYRQIMSVSNFAIEQEAADSAALPAKDDNPYNGVLPGSNAPLTLIFQDVLGNRTQGSSFTLDPAVGYTDDVVGLSAWPATALSYRFFKAVNGANFAATLTIAPDRYMPGAASGSSGQDPAAPVKGANYLLVSGQDPAAKAAAKDAEHYQTISYQMQQHDVTCWLTTSLGSIAQPELTGATARMALLGSANSAYVFLSEAAGLQRIAVDAKSYKTLAAVINPAGTPAGYPVAIGDLAQANSTARADILFDQGTNLTVPINSVVKSGDTAAAIAANAKPAPITVTALADNNADVPLAATRIVATKVRSYAIPAGTTPSLSELATVTAAPLLDGPALKDQNGNAVAAVPGLATTNKDQPLVSGLTLILGSSSYVTGSTNATDTLATVATIFTQKQGSTVAPADVAVANQYLSGIFPANTKLSLAGYVTVTSDTLAIIAANLGPPAGGSGSPAAQMLQGNQYVPDLWSAGTALFITTGTHAIKEGETLSAIASANATTVAAILADNTSTPALVGGTLVLPYLADNPVIAWSTYQANGSETFGGIAGAYDNWSIQQLGALNKDIPGLFQATPISLTGPSITPTLTDTFFTLGQHFGLGPDAFAAQIANLKNLVRTGAVLAAPAITVRKGETLLQTAQRLGTDPGSLAAANACVPGLVPTGQTVTLDGYDYGTYANDAFALLTARINADRAQRNSVKTTTPTPYLPPVSAATVGAVCGAMPLGVRTLMSPPRPAVIPAMVTAADHQAIVHLTASLAISRDPARVAPAFQNAPTVVSALTTIPAQPFASSDSQATLRAFAQDFEAAFAGHKLATGPDQVQGTSLLSKPSMRGAINAKSSNGRGLWVVNFSGSGTGFTYQVKGSTPQFFGVPPLSTETWDGTSIPVPTYDSTTGLSPPSVTPPAWTKTQNFRGVDPDAWNESFLDAIDLFLSPSYAVPGVVSPDVEPHIASVLTAKSDLAAALSNLVVPIIGTDTTGQSDARSTMKQQLLVALARLYEVQALVQFPVTVSSSATDPNTAPQLSGKLMAKVVTTYADDDPDPKHKADPQHPLALLAKQCTVGSVYLAEIIAGMRQIIRPKVTVSFKGGTYTTVATDTLNSIAQRQFNTDVATLAATMTISVKDPKVVANLFLGSTAINVTPMASPASLTALTDVADWFAVTAVDVLTANSERTDFFAAGTSVVLNTTTYTPQANESLGAFAVRVAGSLQDFAEQLGEVDAGAIPGSYTLNPAPQKTPRGLQLIPQLSFTTAKAALASPGSPITSLFSVKDPSAHKSVTLDLDYHVNQLEFDIHTVDGIDSFLSSSWLSFVIPLDEGANTSGGTGLVQIPVPLRGYPAPAVMFDQETEFGWPPDEEETATQWNYRFSMQRQTAAQDQLTLELRFNTPSTDQSVNGSIAPTSPPYEAIIELLAAFSTVWPAIAKDLAKLPDLEPGQAAPPEVKNAAAALDTLVGMIRDAWNALSPRVRLGGVPDEPYIYTLSTLVRGDPPYFSALVLDREERGLDDASADDFIFSFPATPPLQAGPVPSKLATAFGVHGFPLGSPPPQLIANPGGGYSIVDEEAQQTSVTGQKFKAPQTYRVLLDGTGKLYLIYRQVLWPALELSTGPTYTVGANDTLNTIVQANPGLGLDAATLAACNANTLGLLVVGSKVSGQSVGPNDTFGTIAAALGESAEALGTQVAGARGILKPNAAMLLPPRWIGASQSGTRLVFDLTQFKNPPQIGQPLSLDFDFYRLNLLLRQNAWGGSYVSRNANLIPGAEINAAFVYETPLVMFPTKITPYVVRDEVLALPGPDLTDALATFFTDIIAPQAATAPDTQRNIRVIGRYWQAASGTTKPDATVPSFQVPLVLLPIYPFNVTTDGVPDPGKFCDQLAAALKANADAAGIPSPSPGGQYVIDLLVYTKADDSTGIKPPQPLLDLQNRIYPR